MRPHPGSAPYHGVVNLFDTNEHTAVPASDAPKRERPGGRAVAFVVLGLGLLVGGAWTAAYLVAGDKVPRGTTVAGVEVGGRKADAAAAALEEGLAERVTEPIQLDVEGRTVEIDPAQAGLSVDYAASVAEAGGERTWNPGRLWNYFTGGDDLPAVVDLDTAAYERTLERLDERLGTEPVDGAVSFESGGPEITEPEPGSGLDDASTAQALREAVVSEDRTLTLGLSEVQPDIDQTDLDAAREEFVNPAMSGPVTLVFGDSEVQLRPAQFAPALLLEPQDGALVPGLDQAALDELVGEVTSEADSPVDATVRLVNGKPRVVPGKPGVTYEPGAVGSVFLDLVTAAEGERSAEVEATVQEPEFTTEDARALGIRRKVAEFETYFPYAEYRNTNIGRAGELANGTVLKPGEIFSMNEVVGERTEENGFVPGFVISDGIFREDLGGGVSQMATTLYNAGFFAGFEDVEHKPHSFYIDRYPVGREATVVFGVLDMRFRNDTDHGALVEVEVTPSTPSSQGVVRVAIWSTKTWDITTRTSERYNYIAPGTRTLDTPDCYPNAGYSGFSVDVWRYFSEPGSDEIVKQEKIHTDYTPSDTVICRPPGSGTD